MNNDFAGMNNVFFCFFYSIPSFRQISSSKGETFSNHAKFDSLPLFFPLINNIWRERSISRFNKLSSFERVNNERSDFVICLATWRG